jgi:hypothetical protein
VRIIAISQTGQRTVGGWINVTGLHHTFSGLTVGNKYAVDVQANNVFGWSDSGSVTFIQGSILVS